MRIIKLSSILVCLSFLLLFSVFPALAQNLKEEAKRHYDLANEYYRKFQYKEAQEEFKKALDLTNAANIRQNSFAEKAKPVLPEKVEGKGNKKASLLSGAAKASEYVVGEDDVLYVTVWQNKDLDQEVTVRPDGMVSLPLIGDVPAVGLTISEVDSQVTLKLKEYVKYPDVSISVRKIGGKKIIVLGEVESPGVYAVTGKSTVLEAVALAKGFTPHAVVSSIIVIRGGFKKPKGMRLNLNRALLKADLSQNLVLKPEDIIYVPKKFIANVNYFVNQAIGPIAQGAYSTEKLRDW